MRYRFTLDEIRAFGEEIAASEDSLAIDARAKALLGLGLQCLLSDDMDISQEGNDLVIEIEEH